MIRKILPEKVLIHWGLSKLADILHMMTSSNGNIFRLTGHFCGEFIDPRWIPAQRPVTQSFDVFFDLRLSKCLSKQSWGWSFKTQSRPLWRHRNETILRQCFHYFNQWWSNWPAHINLERTFHIIYHDADCLMLVIIYVSLEIARAQVFICCKLVIWNTHIVRALILYECIPLSRCWS